MLCSYAVALLCYSTQHFLHASADPPRPNACRVRTPNPYATSTQFVMFCSYAVALLYGANRIAAGKYTVRRPVSKSQHQPMQ